MSEPFLGEIRMFAGTYAPRNWAFCDGQIIAVSQNEALFSLLGSTYGGDGRTSFGYPDMRGRLPIHTGTGPGLTPRPLGQKQGTETVTLTPSQVPNHTHNIAVSSQTADQSSPAGHILAQNSAVQMYDTAKVTPKTLRDGLIGETGGSQAHSNLQPSLCLNFIISLIGIYPSRN